MAAKPTSKKKEKGSGRKEKVIENRGEPEKPKKRKKSSSSDSSDSDSSDSDDSDSTSSSSSDDDDNVDKKAAKKKKKRKAHLKAVELFWPKQERPKKLRKSKVVAGMSLSKLATVKELVEKERERRGMTSEFGVDRKPKKKKFKEAEDDCATILHPARFLPLPIVEPKEYWSQVPRTREVIFRHLPLQHFGIEGVPEKTVVILHNRKMAVDLDSMTTGKITDLKQAQVAVQNYAMLQRYLHPMDLSGQVIQLVLTEAGWGEGLGGDDRQRVAAVKRFFEDCTGENSRRAARKQEPLDYEQVRSRWVKAVTSAYPQVRATFFGQQMAAMVGGTGQRQQQRQNGGGQQNGSSQPTRGAGAGPQGGQGGQMRLSFNKPARFQGMPVCFGFNSSAGCRRTPAGTTASTCSDGKTHFAHVCNYFIKSKNDHCLANHPKMGNH